jgi:hypothetical protein
VVTLADALHLEAHLAYPEAVAQLALADLISFPRWTWPLEGRRPWTGSRR